MLLLSSSSTIFWSIFFSFFHRYECLFHLSLLYRNKFDRFINHSIVYFWRNIFIWHQWNKDRKSQITTTTTTMTHSLIRMETKLHKCLTSSGVFSILFSFIRRKNFTFVSGVEEGFTESVPTFLQSGLQARLLPYNNNNNNNNKYNNTINTILSFIPFCCVRYVKYNSAWFVSYNNCIRQ